MAAAMACRQLWGAVRDLLWPPQCLGCDRPVAEQGGLCPSCWSALAFITPPHCRHCGLPFDHPVPGELSCGACLADPPPFDRARAPFVYGGTVRRLILAFKHGDRTDMAAALAQRMAAAAPALLAEAELIVPVPLHRWRLWRRRYNQSALLAKALARLSGRPAATGLLLRRRATPSQGGLSRSRRARNVAGAFALSDAAADRIAGRRILLVDDVYTTGATVQEAARVLRRGGAAAVDVIALARVVADRDAPAANAAGAAGAPARVVPDPVRPIS
ncbi:double zinc ribbon domain-containing protein [Marinibaculum pumilum]|uniref:Double zinc ribbon domain-containing protein n=2 Tax=Marinibaculum pumilum TaxID=1766165 RepID=A0ABV7KTB7_9PROT